MFFPAKKALDVRRAMVPCIRVAANLRTTYFSTISVNPNFRNCVDLSMPNKRACHGGSGKKKIIFVILKIHEDMLH